MADDHDVTVNRDSLGGQPTADTPPRPPDAFDWGDLATPELYLAWWETLTPEEQAQERAMRDQHGY